MNIVSLFLNKGIEGFAASELQDILLKNHSTKINLISNGIIMLDNKKIIKCVSNYYCTPEGKKATKKKVANACFYVQKDLQINNVSNYMCDSCHRKCIEMEKNRELKRYY